jgi:hypothetical protein
MESSATSILVSALPFLLILVLWFLLLKQHRGGPLKTQKNFIDPMQEMLEKTIVPEIRALRESVDRLGAEIKVRGDRSPQ